MKLSDEKVYLFLLFLLRTILYVAAYQFDPLEPRFRLITAPRFSGCSQRYGLRPSTPPEYQRNQWKNLIKGVTKIPLVIATISTIFSREKEKSQVKADLYIPPTPSRGYQTKSGLRYFDLYINSNYTQTPRYGQIVVFHYTMYYSPYTSNGKPPKLEILDSSHYEKEPFLQKHGNSQLIRGIDEALHTMRLGSRRRVFIPRNLAYVDAGLGPLPIAPSRRRKLNRYLTEYEQGKGDFIVDLELMMISDDEADAGYYEDIPVDVEEARTAVLKSMEENRNRQNQFLNDLLGGRAKKETSDKAESSSSISPLTETMLQQENLNGLRKENQAFKEK